MRWFPAAATGLVAWGALAFGGEYPWAYAPLLVFGATIGVLGLAAPGAATRNPRLLVLSPALVLAAVAAQLCPLPEAVLAVLSPNRLAHDFPALTAATLPAAPGAATAAVTGSWPLSIAPARTLLGAGFLVALSLFFLGARRALGTGRASRVARGVTAVGLVVALVAIVQEGSGSAQVYGFWWPRKLDAPPAAPLINENHLAGWLLMAFALAAGHLAGSLESRRFPAAAGWRRRVLWLASREGSVTLLAGLSLFVMALAVLFTGSVSGIAGLVLACCAFSWLLSRRARRASGRRIARAALIALPLAAGGWVGLDAVGGELAAASWADVGGRVPIWRDTARIAGDFPLTGAGWNTYGIAMLAYQTHRTDEHIVEAHNDYLQVAAEGGVLVGLPILMAVAAFWREVRSRFRAVGGDARDYWLRVGAVIGIGVLAVQSLVDFSLQMPGNAVLFTLLMAIAAHRPPGPAAFRKGC